MYLLAQTNKTQQVLAQQEMFILACMTVQLIKDLTHETLNLKSVQQQLRSNKIEAVHHQNL